MPDYKKLVTSDFLQVNFAKFDQEVADHLLETHSPSCAPALDEITPYLEPIARPSEQYWLEATKVISELETESNEEIFFDRP